MESKSGKITAINPVPGKSKTTGKAYTTYTAVLEDGTEIDLGFKSRLNVGEYFNERVERKFGKLKATGVPAQLGDVEIPASAPQPPPPSGAAGTGVQRGYPPARTFPVARDSGEISIIRQNALTNAREIVATLQGPLTGWNALTKADRQQVLDSVAEDVLYLAYKFADFSSGQREAKVAIEMARLNPPSV